MLLQRNGMRAICPATVSIIMRILEQWESASSLRRVALNCYALMVIVLQKSSPEEVSNLAISTADSLLMLYLLILAAPNRSSYINTTLL